MLLKLKKMKIESYKQVGQIFVFPTVKITYTRTLNGDLELIFVWIKWGISISI